MKEATNRDLATLTNLVIQFHAYKILSGIFVLMMICIVGFKMSPWTFVLAIIGFVFNFVEMIRLKMETKLILKDLEEN